MKLVSSQVLAVPHSFSSRMKLTFQDICLWPHPPSSTSQSKLVIPASTPSHAEVQPFRPASTVQDFNRPYWRASGKKHLRHSEYTIYTDGSKKSEGAGGFVIYNYNKLSHSASKCKTTPQFTKQN